MAIPKEIVGLVERFNRNREAYKTGNYNETQLRREFLDPFFKALGWDIDNEQGYAEGYKDVIHEDAIKVGEATKAPDYCFRIGGTRKFFLEAKKPAVDIKNDVGPAFQLRRYAWTTKLPLSILSDFEEFAVYDCRFKPDQKDSAAVARILYIPYTEYAARWNEIADIFSRDAVLKGSFDKYAESSKAKRGTADVDDEFLKTIETWRKDLAENLALRNKKLSQRQLNFAVQRIIDRIIFLRICEGRGIEDYGRLRTLATGDRIYQRLGQLFEQADDRYNSGLFHFKAEKGRHEPPDDLTLSLDLDDKLLRGILKNLYYPASPYVFSALPADVLGQVYEQFLGKVIRLTDGHHAKVDDKPEVKNAGGVFYTPTFKGCGILTSIRDFGLLLAPELIEWRQPTTNSDQPRIFPVLQKRVCFTELCPAELPQHARKFGQFALEFEIDTLRRLGAIPVFYIPRPTREGHDGNALGVALFGCTMDASAIIQRLAFLDQILNGDRPVEERLNFSVGFAGNPNDKGNFTIHSAETKNFLRAVGHGATPWGPLNAGIAALLNFFYPADDVKHDKLLDFYRQREWRIACGFAINGIDVLRVPTPQEKACFLEIDQEYFGRQLQTDQGPINMLDCALVHPGLNSKKIIEMVRRVIVPAEAIGRVTDILANLAHPPQVISIDDLET